MYGPQQDDDKKKALQLQAQAAQPVYGPRNPPAGGRPSPLKPAAKPTLAEGDIAQAAAEFASRQQPTNGPSVRFGVPNRRAEPVDQTSLSAAEASKANQWAGGVSDRASGAAIAAVKTSPDGLPPTAAGGEGANDSKPVTPLQSQQTAPQADRGAYFKTGIGQGAAGGEIVGRIGADGVPEFTNNARAQASAGAKPVGGIGRVGDGKGTFSVVGQDGDARLAMERYARANEIRAGIPRQRELGDNGGKVTVVRDSSRSPSIAELINRRLDMQEREANRADRLADSRIATDGSASDRADQKQALDMAKGDVELAAAESALAISQELEAIRQKLADPSLSPDQRAALEATYYAMTSTPAERAAIARDDATHQYRQQRVMADLLKIYSETQPVGEDGKTPIPFEQWARTVLQGDSGSGGGSSAMPMPASAAEAKVGAVYQTAKGPARWDGKQFIPVVS